MAERPLLALPRPTKLEAGPGKRSVESVPRISAGRQIERLGPKFDRLKQVLPDPARLADLRDDPSAIVPERALVFEVTGTLTDFYRALGSIPGLELLGEEDGERAADEDFAIVEKGKRKTAKAVPLRLYFTIPDTEALRELVRLWEMFKAGQPLDFGKRQWKNVFEHLADVRPWGPKDRLTEETISNWRERLNEARDQPIRFEVEFWYRNQEARRRGGERAFAAEMERLGGRSLDWPEVAPIRYQAALVEAPAAAVEQLITHPEVGLAKIDEIMFLRPQSVVGERSSDLESELETLPARPAPAEPGRVVAALFDGLPLAGHTSLAGRLEIDDPDDYASMYGLAAQQRHGTAMASLILHGDLNDTHPPIKHRLYVRPVMFPQKLGFREPEEFFPADRLGVDVMWEAFRRMMEGEEAIPPNTTGVPASAPTVRIVNLSVGDPTRRFAGVMSPWARLIDYLAWKYNLLVLVSAGNVTDPVPLSELATWDAFVNAAADERQAQMLRGILAQRATRRLLSPSEAINSLTVGGCYDDNAEANGTPPMAIAPYTNNHLPNPSSALGLGFHRGIKPELLFPGGREQMRTRRNHAPIEVKPVGSPVRYFGIKAAAPGRPGETNFVNLHNGTSVATALAANSAIRILESIEDMPADPAYPVVDDHYHGVILKALLVHAARWNEETTELIRLLVDPNKSLHHEHVKDELTRLFGYGRPEIERVLDCTVQRATLIGWGTIRDKEIDQYRVPLPAGLEGIRGFRAVTVTIAWLTPVNLSHRMYRMAKLEGSPGGDKNFSLGVDNAQVQPSHNAVVRGTVFHRRWEGEKAVSFTDNGDLLVNVSCKAAAGEMDADIMYGVTISVEVGQDVAVPVYEEVKTRLRAAVRVVP
jgi:hypothetical protein